MKRTAVGLVMALGLLVSACTSLPDTVATGSARTAVPTWTLPFNLETSTSAARTAVPVRTLPFIQATSTPAPATPLLASATHIATGGATTAVVEPTAAPTETPPPPLATEVAPVSPPRLLIPDLKLDREVEHVGIRDGIWELTALGDEVGWLSTTGQYPGDNLAVVLVGHVTTAPGQYGPFAGIGTLSVDDQIIYRWAGQDYVYAVRGTTKANEADVERLYVPDGRQLLLVTCSNYDLFSNMYQRRLIVTAEWIGTMASQ